MTTPPDILLVDADEAIQQTLDLILRQTNHQIMPAETADQALSLARQQFFNIALIDLHNPDPTDTDLVIQLKELHPDMEILLITGYATLENAMQAVTRGATYYFIKPLNMDEVLEKIKEVLERQHLVLENKRLYQAAVRELAERKQAEEELHRRNRELTLLNRIIAASATRIDPESILEITCREVALAFNLPQAVAFLPNPQKTAKVVVAEYLVDDSISLIGLSIPAENNPIAEMLFSQKSPIIISDVQNDERLAQSAEILKQLKAVTMLIVPLTIDNEIVGTLNFSTTETRSFSDEEIDLIWSVAGQVSGALARTRLDKGYRRLSAVIEQSAESVIITDTKGTIIYVNPAFERVTGYSREETVGKNPNILNSGRHDADFFKNLWDTLTAGQVWHGRLVNRKKDGSLYTEETIIGPVRDEDGNIVNYVSLQRDVTRELQLEEQYRRSQRMDAVGQLTGGIAHDFNNLLTAINGFAELLQFRLPANDPQQELVKNILISGQRAANLVSQLLAFSRKTIIEPKVLNLNTIVVNMGSILRRVIGEDIELRLILTPDLWSVKVDLAQFEQVIMNLAVNARDAMPNGGKLIIETSNVVLDADYVERHLGAQIGKHVLLAISDTGMGMSKEVQARIFEPFFTTKEVGKGTGLGLATVFGTIKQSGGNIWVYSEEGQGTTFKVYLPRVKDIAQTTVTSSDQVLLPIGSETILLVEDDNSVRDLVREILQAQGYNLLEATNGEDAQQIVASYNQSIHLLLTDVVMPGISGKILAEQLFQQQPNLKVLFMSGYTENVVAHHGVLEEGVAFIQKPFNAATLAQQIRAVLDA